MLRRLGLGRLSRLDPKPPVVRYQRERPGELIHVDVKKLGRIGPNGPGYRVTGRRKTNRKATDAAGSKEPWKASHSINERNRPWRENAVQKVREAMAA